MRDAKRESQNEVNRKEVKINGAKGAERAGFQRGGRV